MHNPHGFKTIEKEERSYLDPAVRIKNFKEFLVPLSDDKIQKQSERCMSCGIPYCHNGCPVNNMIPDWNDLVYNNRWQEALKLLHDQTVLNEDEVQIIILTEEENKDVITYLKLMGYPTMISFYEGTQQYFFSGVEEKQFNRFLELNKKLLQ